jgi:acetylornithine deacetylase
MSLDIARTLSNLVSIPSVNPMGRESLTGNTALETALTKHLEELFSQLGLPARRQNVHPGRDNIITRLDGETPPEAGGSLVMFEVHQDTVPVDGMTVPPFSPTVSDGRLYGRGACDVKGGMTAMLVALSRLARERPKGMPTVLLACTVNEEHGFTGASALCQTWTEGCSAVGDLIPRAPDVCVVAEPTELQVVVAHKGVVRWRCRTTGRAAHSSRPEAGANAIYKMAKVISALERYAAEEMQQRESHPLCGRPTLSVGTIHGGLSVNTVPENCGIEIDRRLCPGEDGVSARNDVIDYLVGLGLEAIHDPPLLTSHSLSGDTNTELAEKLVSAARDCQVACRTMGVPYGTDAAPIAAAQVPSVVFGPGSIKQAHTADEWIELAQVEKAAEVLFRFCAAWE